MSVCKSDMQKSIPLSFLDCILSSFPIKLSYLNFALNYLIIFYHISQNLSIDLYDLPQYFWNSYISIYHINHQNANHLHMKRDYIKKILRIPANPLQFPPICSIIIIYPIILKEYLKTMSERTYPVVTVDDRCESRIRAGHVWVYESDVTADTKPADGVICDVVSRRGRYLGTGFYNSASKIRVRILSTNANDTFDEAFWERRVRYAIEYRRTVMRSPEDFLCCRLIFGEADQFPGLTVDRMGDVLVTETLSLGIEQRKHIIFPAIVRVLAEMGVPVRALYERNDVAIRKLEGMEENTGFYTCEGLEPDPAITETEICENGIYYYVDFMHGQKTGFFLDQKYNRLAAARLAKGRTVLDCFTHTGSFALNAAKAGAKHVDAVDISADAIAMTRRNAERNGLAGSMDFICADVFAYLDELNAKK